MSVVVATRSVGEMILEIREAREVSFSDRDNLSPEQINILLTELSDATGLESISLVGLGLSDEKAGILGNIVSRNPRLKRLCLDDNNLTGNTIVYILGATSTNGRLVHFSADNQTTPITSTALKSILQLVKSTSNKNLRTVALNIGKPDLETVAVWRLLGEALEENKRRCTMLCGNRRLCSCLCPCNCLEPCNLCNIL